jgi:CRISPR-associated endonuclease/helicase Cas3
MNYRDFFVQATANPKGPYPYQERLATEADFPQLLDVPTGLGKTAAVVLAWLWRRRFADEETRQSTPRRLVYCLPMRVLVEQTRDNARQWLTNLSLQDEIKVHVLMGGEEADDWGLYPERDAILIGTQDMLLSRALNRGYGMSRYRWPMHFALLNNDCLWVFDETQLMGVGVETSAQLDAFRSRVFRTHAPTHSLWMSATLGQSQLETVDHPEPEGGWSTHTLAEADHAKAQVRQRVQARKPLAKLPITLSKDTAKTYPKEVADAILKSHEPETLTLAVVNRVNRAQEVYENLLKLGRNVANTALVHSRFREQDRKQHEHILLGKGDRIVVATQAVEAGVDVSARTLITELAPWASLVQRFGRCNRYGEFKEGAVFWMDIRANDEKDNVCLPYVSQDLKQARTALEKLTDVGPQLLPKLAVAPVIRPVLRRKDLLDLFDTTPDLCGNDLDVSRYIRDGQDTDVQVFWRDLGDKVPAEDLPEPTRAELCSVSIGRFREFLKKKQKPRVWRWNPLEERWEPVSEARPGQTYLIERASGGYSDKLGWTGDPEDVPSAVQPTSHDPQESYADDKHAFIGPPIELTKHLEHVVEQTEQLVAQLGLSRDLTEALIEAARWHDVGKAHGFFQQMLRESNPNLSAGALWAKSGAKSKRTTGRERKGFRHELASALAWLQVSPETAAKNLVAYLIAAHHGRVRLSIRSLPNETEPPQTDRLFARGIWDGDELPAVGLGNGDTMPAVKLDLSFMQMGDGPRGASWLARMVQLRDDPDIGPFRLAFCETLLRIADWRASAQELEGTG